MTQHKPFTIEEIDQMLEAVNFTQGRMSLPFERSLALLTLARASLAQAPSDEEIMEATKEWGTLMDEVVAVGVGPWKKKGLEAAVRQSLEKSFEAGARAFARKPRLSWDEIESAAVSYVGDQYEASAILAFKAGYALAWEGEK